MPIRPRIALCLLFIAPLAFAQKPVKPETAQAAQHSTLLKTLRRGNALIVNRMRYEHLPEVFALERASQSETPAAAIARIGSHGGETIETRGNLLLYRSPQAKQARAERLGGTNVYPTVLNTHSGKIGVLTGVLVVKPRSMADARSIADSHGLEIVHEYPQLQTVLVRVAQQADIIATTTAIGKDARVANLYPEIIEHRRTPR
ncbi:MAG: hypothetical protein OEW21_09625 [Betaproteobacteria bacterium]|nr:hypothetical protein [Betaproteobacteria bacterium]